MMASNRKFTRKIHLSASEIQKEVGAKAVATINVAKDIATGRRLKINVKTSGFTKSEEIRHQAAEVEVEHVINSKEFKRQVLAYHFDTLPSWIIKSTWQETSAAIYDFLMTGQEMYPKKSDVDYEMDVNVAIYYKRGNVVGYTSQDDPQTHLNRNVTYDYGPSDIADNMVHEWTHKMGFDHSSASDYESVPYHIGYIVEALAKRYEKGERFEQLYPEIVVIPTTPVEVPPTTGPVVVTPPVVTPPIVIPTPTVMKTVCYRPWYGFGLIKRCYDVKA